MKLVTYLSKLGDQTARVGMRVSAKASNEADGFVVDFEQAVRFLNRALPEGGCHINMVSFVEKASECLPLAREIETAFKKNDLPQELLHPEGDITFLAPLHRPRSLRDAYAFRQHVETARRNRGLDMIPEYDEFPVFYYANHLNITGGGRVFARELVLEQMDYELEVAAVIGKEGRNILAQNADEHIFGYMIFNDWSARGIWQKENKLSMGPAKSKDFSSSFGPYLVPREDLKTHLSSTAPAGRGGPGERYDLTMKAWLNGKLLSQGNFKDMHWSFAQILERLSYGVTLYPGEVIGSGTVGTGCLLELNGSKVTQNLWLKPGDEVILEVDELGRLTNTVEKEVPGTLTHTDLL